MHAEAGRAEAVAENRLSGVHRKSGSPVDGGLGYPMGVCFSNTLTTSRISSVHESELLPG